MKIKTLTLGLLSLFAYSATAATANSPIPKANYDWADALLDNDFFKNSKMSVAAKNYWKYLKEDAGTEKLVHNAWGQGIILDYKSGYLFDFIGFDTSYYGAVKLGASDYFATRGVLYNDGAGADKDNATGYSKFGQRYVKLKADLGELQLRANGGWQSIKNIGVLTTSTRLSPVTYLGWSGSATYDNVALRGAYVTRSIDRSSPDKLHFASRHKQHIGYIATGDVLYKNDLVSAQYAYGESQDYTRRHLFFGTVKPAEKLTIGTQLYFTQALSSYKEMNVMKRQFDNHANHYALDAHWRENRWSAKVGLAYTDAQRGDDQLGFYNRHMTNNSRGTFTSMTTAGEDYMRDGEKVLSLLLDYKLYDDLTVGFAGNYGQFGYKGVTVRTGEANLFTRWVPDHKRLKGLTLWTMFGTGWSYKNDNKTPILRDGDYQTAHSLSAEFIAEYRFNLF